MARFRGSRSAFIALAFLVPGFAALAVELTRYWNAGVPISGAVIGIAAVCLFVGGSILDPTKARIITGTAVTEGLRVLDGVMVWKRIGRRSTDPLVPVEPPAAAEVPDGATVIIPDAPAGDRNAVPGEAP